MYQHNPIRTANTRRFFNEIAERCKQHGFDLNRPITTIGGDDVVILATQDGHPWPIIGEIQDWNADRCWFGRWNEEGYYEGTREAREQHSWEPNTPPVTVQMPPIPAAPSRLQGAALDAKLPPLDKLVAGALSPEDARLRALVCESATKAMAAGQTSPHTAVATTMYAAALIKSGRLKIKAGITEIPFDALERTVGLLSRMPKAEARFERMKLDSRFADNFRAIRDVLNTPPMQPMTVTKPRRYESLGPTPVAVGPMIHATSPVGPLTPNSVHHMVHPDTARLNWLERNRGLLNHVESNNRAHIHVHNLHYYDATYRDVLDRAMKVEQSKEASSDLPKSQRL